MLVQYFLADMKKEYFVIVILCKTKQSFLSWFSFLIRSEMSLDDRFGGFCLFIHGFQCL